MANNHRPLLRSVQKEIEKATRFVEDEFKNGKNITARLITLPDGTQWVLQFYTGWDNTGTITTDLSTLPECCYGGVISKQTVFDAIEKEREYQNNKWGEDKQQSLAGFLLILEAELEEAKLGWMEGVSSGRHSPLNEILQLAAVAVACLEQYGTDGITINKNDGT